MGAPAKLSTSRSSPVSEGRLQEVKQVVSRASALRRHPSAPHELLQTRLHLRQNAGDVLGLLHAVRIAAHLRKAFDHIEGEALGGDAGRKQRRRERAVRKTGFLPDRIGPGFVRRSGGQATRS